MMSADATTDRVPHLPRCPMCREPVTPGPAAMVEQGEAIHIGCRLGLMDAGAAVARLLCERPGRALCAACIARALGLTFGEAQVGSGRLRALRGFELRFEQCGGCGSRRQVVRAFRARAWTAERPSDVG